MGGLTSVWVVAQLQAPEGGQEPYWVSLRQGRARAERRLQRGLGQVCVWVPRAGPGLAGKVGTSSPRSRRAEHTFLRLSVQAQAGTPIAHPCLLYPKPSTFPIYSLSS